MTAYLVDTNHLSVLVTEEHPLRQRVIGQLQSHDSFAIAAPILNEILFGFLMTPRAKKNLAAWGKLNDIFGFYEIDRRDAERAANLQADLRRRGWQLHTVDALIAAVALRYDLTLLTKDRDFSTVVGLNTENWLI